MALDSAFIMKKAGPLPVWGWMAIGLGALIVFSAYRKKASGTATPVATTQGFNNMPAGTQYDPNSLTVIQEGYNPPVFNLNSNVQVPDVAARAPQYTAFGKIGDGIYGQVDGGPWKWLDWKDWQPYNNAANVARFVNLTPNQVAPAPAASSPAPVAHPSAPSPQTVTVAPWNSSNPWNSTLSGIAQHFYNDASQYGRIAQANGIANPNLIYPGQQIVIP